MKFLRRLFTRAESREKQLCNDPECNNMRPADEDRLSRDRADQERMWQETQSIRDAAERFGDDGARRRYLVEIERDVIQRRRQT